MSRQDKIGSHKTSVFAENGFTRVLYHQTQVVKFNEKQIRLNSNGWATVTTKLRMNQASNQFNLGYRVFQKDFEWFVDYQGKTMDYYDGMVLDRLVS